MFSRLKHLFGRSPPDEAETESLRTSTEADEAYTVLYRGVQTPDGCRIERVLSPDPGPHLSATAPLALRRDLFDWAMGFRWGHHCTGAFQTALALLAHALGNDLLANKYSGKFMYDVVAKLPYEGWTLTREEICDWVANRRLAIPATPRDE